MRPVGQRVMSCLTLFVLSHDDQLAERVPRHPVLHPIDLRTLTFPTQRWADNRLAESRWFLSNEGGGVATPYVGVLSARHDEKWADRPSLNELADVVPRLPQFGRHRGLGANLIRGTRIIEWAEEWHPGIGVMLDAVVAEFRLQVRPGSVPLANTFICHVDRYHELRAFMRAAVEFVELHFGEEPAFSHRCELCQMDAGECDYHRGRRIGFVCERLTMLFFADGGRVRFASFAALDRRVYRSERLNELKMDMFRRLPNRMKTRLSTGASNA